MREYKVLHKVMLVLDGAQGFVPGDVKKHNQEIFRIGRVHRYKNLLYYELIGLESKHGVPYSIPHDWLYDIGSYVE